MKKLIYLLIFLLLITGCNKPEKEIQSEMQEEALVVAETPSPTPELAETAVPAETSTPTPSQIKESPKPTSTVAAVTAATPTPATVKTEQPKEAANTPPPTPVPAPEPKKDIITLYVKGKDSVIFPKTEIEFKENQTVFDLLKEVMRKNNIIVEDTGVGSNKYVEGIDNLYEFDHGPKSGWVYFVNGKLMDRSSGQTAINKNDKISWYYTLDLGNDIVPE